MGETGFVFMITHKGAVLAYPPDTKKIMKLDLSTFEFGQKMLEMKNGTCNYEFEDADLMSAFSQVPMTGWVVVAVAPEKEVFAEAEKIRTLLLIIGAIVTFVLCAGIVVLSNLFITRPIKRVVESIKDIAQGEGDLTRQLPVNSQDELGELSTWFNTFLGNLQQIVKDIADNSGQVGNSSGQLLDSAQNLAKEAKASSQRSDSAAKGSESVNANMNGISQTMGTTMDNTTMVAAATERNVQNSVSRFRFPDLPQRQRK
ncbi:MAG: methyl-accepting chemotaxis protein [Desulfobacter sp.]|nr:MAG: methyl-accepting chemotaxis protein [Desulfobacter sp.]